MNVLANRDYSNISFVLPKEVFESEKFQATYKLDKYRTELRMKNDPEFYSKVLLNMVETPALKNDEQEFPCELTFETKTLIKNFKKSFDSIMLPKEESKSKNYLRLLEVDYRLVLPSRTYVRIEVTSEDVIHS